MRQSTTTPKDGWTTIPGRNRAPPAAVQSSFTALSLHDETQLPSLDALKEKLEKRREEVLACEALGGVMEVTSQVSRRKGKDEKMLLLGLGRLTGATRESALLQLALGLEIQERLAGVIEKEVGGETKSEIPQLLVYDPVFTDFDKGFLSSLPGVTVSSGPPVLSEGREEVITMLYAPHLEYPVLLASLAQHRPNIVLCNDLQNFVDSQIGGVRSEEMAVIKEILGNVVIGNTSSGGSRKRRRKRKEAAEEEQEVKSEAGYKALVLQGVDGSDDIGGGRAFNHLALYWRKELEIEDDEIVGDEEEGKR